MDILQAYAKEIGVETMTLESLIRSHRTLREQAVVSNAERRAELDTARKRAAALAREEVMHGEYISRVRLAGMTMKEIAEIVVEI